MSASILVVEDNPDSMKLLRWIVEEEGYEFEGVVSAEAALQSLEQRGFDLILMDIALPGMSGKEATRQLRADARFTELPIVAVTAHAIRDEQRAIRDSGVSALVTKPIDEDLLVEIMRSLLGGGCALG